MAEYLFTWSLGFELRLLWEIKEHGMPVTNLLTVFRWLPLSFGVATYAVPVFDLEKTDSGTLVVWSRVEVFWVPPMNRSTVEKCSD